MTAYYAGRIDHLVRPAPGEQMDTSSLSVWQRAVLYWFDQQCTRRCTRRIVAYKHDIARDLGTNKRRVIDAVNALERKGYLYVTRRRADHGGWAASEYLCMPANPRKQQQAHWIAAAINADPKIVLDALSRVMESETAPTLDTDLTPIIGAVIGDVSAFEQACEGAGLSLRHHFAWS